MGLGTKFNGLMSRLSFHDEFSSERPALQDIMIGDFRLVVESRVAYVCNKKLELNAAEFDLLRYLLTHDKNLVTARTMLTTADSGASSLRQVKVLETLLSLKRKLADAAPGVTYLRTEPWVFYNFSAAPRLH